jgi:membrane associated rhomboid family serine protease
MKSASITREIRQRFEYGNVVTKIILVNVGVFVAFGIFHLITFLLQSNSTYLFVLQKLEVTASLQTLLLQPWSLFTYMFLHTGIFHILFNMLWLYWFGEIFVLYLGEKKIVPLYITGGVAGAGLYILTYNLLPVFSPMLSHSFMLGASASIFAIVFAAATIHPDHEISLLLIGPVKIKYVALFSLLLDVINIPYGNSGGYIAHVGGAALGFAYIKALQSGFDVFSVFEKKKAVKLSHRNTESVTTKDLRNEDEQTRVDEILDKIARSGYDSLKKDEKDFLFRYSNK